MMFPAVPGWAIFLGVSYTLIAGASLLCGVVKDWRYRQQLQKRRNAELMRWLDDGADWLFESSVDQELEQR